MRSYWLIPIALICAAAGYLVAGHNDAPRRIANDRDLNGNDQYIGSLYRDLDVDNPKDVFAYVFTSLAPEVTVYPSENVYYVRFTARGRNYNATISLPPHERDSGIVSFGYVERYEHKSRQKYYPIEGGQHDFGPEDGLFIAKLDGYTYRVEYLGRTVLFHLHKEPIAPPRTARLRDDEEFIGPTFDESGLRFYLVFNHSINRMIWLLNEDGFVPESFFEYSNNVMIGDRTEFAFYHDRANKRKIMIGVEGENVLQNNWYDGPFDHLPDNYIHYGDINIQPYLEKQYPQYRKSIDKFGRFKHRPGSRIAVATYQVYFKRAELDYVDSLVSIGTDYPELLQQLTRQSFRIPPEYAEYDL